MSSTRVTGVIPLHNHAKWVCHAVASMAANTHQPDRIVVVDDGSTDRGYETLLDELQSPSPIPVNGTGPESAWEGTVEGVPVIAMRYATARGPSFARNSGIVPFADETDVFVFLDSDDYYSPNKIEQSLKEWDKNREAIGIVYSDYDTLNKSGVRVRMFKEPFSRRRITQECIINSNSLVSVKALRAVGGFNETLRVCEDYELWLRITEQFLAVHIPQPLLTMRVGSHSSTATVPSEVWNDCYRRTMIMRGIWDA